jgi:hypothetical protein
MGIGIPPALPTGLGLREGSGAVESLPPGINSWPSPSGRSPIVSETRPWFPESFGFARWTQEETTMTLLHDKRQAARTINDALNRPRTLDDLVKFEPAERERVVEWHERAYLFGHYDSRGGAYLVLALNLNEATGKYAVAIGVDEDEFDLAGDDYIKRVSLVVLDLPLPANGSELLADYTDTASRSYDLMVIEHKFGRRWSESETLVLFRAIVSRPSSYRMPMQTPRGSRRSPSERTRSASCWCGEEMLRWDATHTDVTTSGNDAPATGEGGRSAPTRGTSSSSGRGRSTGSS